MQYSSGMSVNEMNLNATLAIKQKNKELAEKSQVKDALIIGGEIAKEQEKFLKSDYQMNFNTQSDEFQRIVTEADTSEHGHKKSPFLYIPYRGVRKHNRRVKNTEENGEE